VSLFRRHPQHFNNVKKGTTMAVKMVFEPNKEICWDKPVRSGDDTLPPLIEYPPFSIAIDGYCKGGPKFNQERMVMNINHHEEVDRVATRSSCYQALVLVNLGIYESFCDEGGRPSATLYLNDCDQDVALATYILMHPEHVGRPKLKHLVLIEDLMDMSGGLYPTKKRLHLVKQLNWIMQPYTKVRSSGEHRQLDAAGMERLVNQIHWRIRQCLFGRAKETDVDSSFEVLAENPGWVLVRERGEAARVGMAEKKIKAFASLIGESEGRYHYTLGRLSQFIPFPLPKLYAALNKAEGLGPEAEHRWGGSDTIGGSPRDTGSGLPPERLQEVINSCLRRQERSSARDK